MSSEEQERWARLGQLVKERREDLHLTQAGLGLRSGTSEPTIRSIERQRRQSFTAATLRSVAAALGWSADSADLILHGLDPVPAEHDERLYQPPRRPPEPAHVTQYRVNDLEVKVERLETAVAELKEELTEPPEPAPATVTELPSPPPDSWHDLVPDLDDEDEVKMWSFTTYSEDDRRMLIWHMRQRRAEANRPHRDASGA